MAELTLGQLVVEVIGDPRKFEASMARVNSQLKAQSQRMQQMGRTMSASLTLPLVAVGVAVSKLRADFDRNMSEIVGLVGVQRDQVEAWKADIVALGPAVGRTAGELSKAMFFITSAGLRASVALDTLKVSAMASAAGLGETKDVAFAAVSALNAYGQENLTANKAVAILLNTVKEGNVEAATLAPVLGRVVPIASELGVSFNDVGAALAAMTRLGLNAEESATALRATLITLLKPSKQAENQLAKFGLSADEVRSILREQGLLSLLTKLKTEFEGNTVAMGQVFRNTRALNGVLSLVGSNAQATTKIFKSLAATTEDDLAKAFGVAAETDAFRFRQAIADLNVAAMELGQKVLPLVIPLVEKVAAAAKIAAESFAQMSPVTQSVVLGLVAAAAAAGPLLLAVGLLGSAVSTVSTALTVQLPMLWATIGAKKADTVVTIANTAANMGYTKATTNLGRALATSRVQNMAMASSLQQSGMTVSAFGKVVPTAGRSLTALAGSSIAAKAGLVGLAFSIGLMIGDAIRPFINELLGLNEALDLVAGTTTEEVAKGLLENSKAYYEALSSLDAMQKHLGLTNQELSQLGNMSMKSALRIVELQGEIQKLSKASREEAKAVASSTSALAAKERTMLQVEEALRKSTAAHETFVNSLQEERGLLTQEDVVAKLKEMGVEYDDLLQKGIHQNQLQGAYRDDFVELIKLAKDYGIELPKGAENLSKSMAEGQPEIAAMLKGLTEEATRDFTLSGAKMLTVIEDTTGRAGEAFGQAIILGTQQGFRGAEDEFVNWQQKIESEEIRIHVDEDALKQQFDRTLSRAVSDVGGGAGV